MKHNFSELIIRKILVLATAAALCSAALAQDADETPAVQQDTATVSNAPSSDTSLVPTGDTTETQEVEVASPEAAPIARDEASSGHRDLGDLVVFGRNVQVNTNESARDVVVIFGTVTIRGSAQDAVAILGNVVSEGGETRDTVAVLGNVRLGTNATVKGDVVAVAGNLEMGPGAQVTGDAVSVGGGMKMADDAKVGGDVIGFEGLGWLGDYVEHCVLKLRPLALDLPWLWAVVAVVGLLYLLVALVFGRAVKACATEISTRPATTFLIGLLTKFLLAPAVSLILAITGIGAILIPFLAAAMLFATVLGKVGLLQFLGQQLGRQTGLAALEKPVTGFLVGWLILTGLYLIPVVGFVVMTITSIWAVGAAVMAMFGGSRKELPQSPPVAATPGAAPAATAFAAAPPYVGNVLESQAAPAAAMAAELPGISPLATGAPQASADATTWLALPRAGFWERMAAAFLDVMLVAIINGLIKGGPFGLLVALAYFSGMWAWRGTTIGGIVLNLKVVRFDGQPMSFAVALVRALMAAFSVIVLFLGFLWIAFTPDRQAWHDKIAGTIVVRQPKGTPLLCL